MSQQLKLFDVLNFSELCSIKKGRVLFDFEAIGTNELSVSEDDIVYLLEDLEDEDEGWSLVVFHNKKGIIPTRYYQLLTELCSPRSPRSENAWKIKIKIVRIEYLSGVSSSPIIISWATKRKTGNTGVLEIPVNSFQTQTQRNYKNYFQFIKVTMLSRNLHHQRVISLNQSIFIFL
jgi:hypothetical protein